MQRWRSYPVVKPNRLEALSTQTYERAVPDFSSQSCELHKSRSYEVQRSGIHSSVFTLDFYRASLKHGITLTLNRSSEMWMSSFIGGLLIGCTTLEELGWAAAGEVKTGTESSTTYESSIFIPSLRRPFLRLSHRIKGSNDVTVKRMLETCTLWSWFRRQIWDGEQTGLLELCKIAILRLQGGRWIQVATASRRFVRYHGLI